MNKPPRADISPKEQTITLPTNEVVLDGSSEYTVHCILYMFYMATDWPLHVNCTVHLVVHVITELDYVMMLDNTMYSTYQYILSNFTTFTN